MSDSIAEESSPKPATTAPADREMRAGKNAPASPTFTERWKGCCGGVISGWTELSLAFILLRLWIGALTFIQGMEKFEYNLYSDIGEFVKKDYSLSEYTPIKPEAFVDQLKLEPLVFAGAVDPFAALLGFALIILGAYLLLGVFVRTSLFLIGLIYICLSVGFLTLDPGNPAYAEGYTRLAIYVTMCAIALCLAKHNRLCITKRY